MGFCGLRARQDMNVSFSSSSILVSVHSFFFFFCFLSNLDFRNEQPLSWIAPLHNHTPTKRQPIHEFVPMIPTISNIALLAPLQSSTDQSADLVKWSTLVVSLAASAFKH